MLTLALSFACSQEAPPKVEAPKPPPAPAAVTIPKEKLGAFSALPTEMKDEKHPSTPALVDLGRVLYYETRLSKNQQISCNSCHLFDKYGVDGTPTSTGFGGQKGGRNAPPPTMPRDILPNSGMVGRRMWKPRPRARC